MGVIRFKIWSDLWQNKARTLQVVLIIGLGAAALGMIVGTRNLVIEVMAGGWRSIHPATINLLVNPRVDDNVVENLKTIDGLVDVEGYTSTSVEWRLNPEDDWRAAGLVARKDYDEQQYNRISLLGGQWPKEKVLAAEESTVAFFQVPADGTIYLKADGREHEVQIGGVVDDEVLQPPSFGGNAQFYISKEYLNELTNLSGYNILLATGPEYDPNNIKPLDDIVDVMENKLKKQGVDSGGFLPPTGDPVLDPDRHFFQDVMEGIFLVLTVLAVLALLLSLLLVYNTINALISQQVDQIGIMKAIGARSGRILFTYLALVFSYSFLALMIALPLGALGGWMLTIFLVNSFNADPGSFVVSWPAVIAQLTVVFLAPLLAALVPIINGSRITVNQAINTYGLTARMSTLDRVLAQLKRLPRLALLTISNTFRKKGRVILTQVTLVLSGLIFMMVMTARDSAAYTFSDLIFSILRFDISLSLQEPERIERIETMSEEYPGVMKAELWGLNGADIRPQGTPARPYDDPLTGIRVEPDSAILFGVPLPTDLYGHQLRAGRWLLPDDKYAVVLNQKLANDAGISIGDWVTFNHGVAGESDWQVVGLLFDPVITNSAHVSREVLLRELGNAGKASSIWIQTDRHDPASQLAIAKGLRDYLESYQIRLDAVSIFGADTSSQITAQIMNNFGIIVTLLLTMAFVIAIVGGIALSGTLSLSVIERRREIGVMRAIGAKSRSIGFLFVGEGLLLGLLSWAIAVPLSIPAGQFMVQAIGGAIGNEIVYQFTPIGPVIWLVIIVVLSIVASYFPSRSAIRISVRESLAYQ